MDIIVPSVCSSQEEIPPNSVTTIEEKGNRIQSHCSVQKCIQVSLKRSSHTLSEPNQMGIFQDHTLFLTKLMCLCLSVLVLQGNTVWVNKARISLHAWTISLEYTHSICLTSSSAAQNSFSAIGHIRTLETE